ncbi:MAG: O-antigen ligase family protein, partial [Candidatus Omnitrophota bacterium]
MAVLLFASFCLFFNVINIIDKKSRFERLLVIIILWAVGLSFYGIMKKFFVSGGWVHADPSFGTFHSRNLYAAYMVMIAPLTIGYALSCKDRYKSILFGFLGAIISVSIFVSTSRGGVLSLIFALLLLSFFSFKGGVVKENLWVIIVFIIILVILAMAVDLGPLKGKLFDLFGRSGIITRWIILKDAVGMVKDFPLFGIGLGNAQQIYTQYKTHS